MVDFLLMVAGFIASSLIVGSLGTIVVKFISSAISEPLSNIDTNKGTKSAYDGSRYDYVADRIPPIFNDVPSSKTDTKITAKKELQINSIKSSNTFKKINDYPYDEEKTPIQFTQYDKEKLKKTAQKDAATENYQVLYSQSKKNQEIYNNAYKTFRKEIIQQMAHRDASVIHNYDIRKTGIKPIPEGKKLSVPAEIQIYQTLFVKKMAKLKENHEQITKERQRSLQELYGQKEPSFIDQEQFYKFF